MIFAPHSVLRRAAISLVTGALTLSLPFTANTAIFQGGGLQQGLQDATGITGISTNSDARSVITTVLTTAVSFTALIGVIAVVVAGFYLLFSFGNEDSRGKAQKIIIYTLAGLFIIFIARIIVGLVTEYLPDVVN